MADILSEETASAHAQWPARGRSRRLAVLPVLAFPVLLGILAAFDDQTHFESPLLYLATNLLFVTIICLAVAVFSARSYLAHGLPSALVLGCGLLAVGAGGVFCGLGHTLGRSPDFTMAVHNTGLLVFAACGAGSAYLTLRGGNRTERGPGKPLILAAAYLATLLAMTLVVAAKLKGLPVVFFEPATGPTNLRALVLLSALILLAATAGSLLTSSWREREAFTNWHGLGLLLVMTGVAGFLLADRPGTPLSWLGRLAQYLGFLYILAAVAAAYARAKRSGLPPQAALKSFFLAEDSCRQLVESSTDIIFRVDRHLLVIYVNPAAERLLGRPMRDHLGRRLLDLGLREPSRAALEAAIRRAVEYGLEGAVEFECETASGQRLIHCGLIPERDANGRVTSVLGVGRDITTVRRQETRFRTIFEQAAVGIDYVTPEGRYVLVNGKLCEILGYSREELLGRTFQDITHGDDLEPDLELHNKLLRGEIETYSLEKRFVRKDGRLIWTTLTTAVERDSAGRVSHVIGIVEDITERKRAEDALRASEERLRMLFLGGPDPASIVFLDEGRRMEVNDEFVSLFGYTRDEINGRSTFALGLWADPKERLEHQGLLAAQGRVRNFEARIRTKSGRIKTVLVSSDLLRIRGGLCSIAVLKDITERKRLEQDLHSREQEFRALAENSPDIIVRIGSDLRRLYANPAIRELTGSDRSSYVGLHVREPIRADRATFSREYEEKLKRVLASGREDTYEYAIPTPGGLRHYHCRLAPEFSLTGQVTSVLSISREVTTYKKLELELRAAREEAERASRAKSEFLANMSHELRTPMNAILGLTELAFARSSEDKVREYLGLAKKSAKSLLGIINSLLDLAKIESGRMEMDRAAFDPRGMFDELLQTLGLEAERKGLRFDVEVHPNVPPRALGDEGRLRQVLVNLVGNALKFTEQGQVRVDARLEEPELPDGASCAAEGARTARLLVSVRDTGIGIPADKLQDIFAPFDTGGKSARYDGTGLGLAISRQLVELMGGSLWVESRPGQGSVFTFTVSIGAADGPEPAAESPCEGQSVQARPLRILLAEDNEINSFLAVDILEEQGHNVHVVANGVEALKALKSGKYDLVLMDVRMPVMDGEETIRRIRAGEAGDPRVPVVALTAYAHEDDRQRFLAAGMDEYLSKPIDFAELDRILARIGRKRSEPPPSA